MIVYKWVYQKEGKYYSLMNYGYCRMNLRVKTNQKPYELGKIYTDISESEKLKTQLFDVYKTIPKMYKPGFYFWKEKKIIDKNQRKWMRKLGSDINAILECEIEEKDILSFEWGGASIRARKFKAIREEK